MTTRTHAFAGTERSSHQLTRAYCVAAQVGPHRPASGNEIGDAALVKLLSDKLDELRKRQGKSGKTVSLNYTVPPDQQSRSWEVRLSSSDLSTTGFPGGVMRGNFIEVDGSYLTVVDPLPCIEFGAQSPASGSTTNSRSLRLTARPTCAATP